MSEFLQGDRLADAERSARQWEETAARYCRNLDAARAEAQAADAFYKLTVQQRDAAWRQAHALARQLTAVQNTLIAREDQVAEFNAATDAWVDSETRLTKAAAQGKTTWEEADRNTAAANRLRAARQALREPPR